jgi:hypothetical protein
VGEQPTPDNTGTSTTTTTTTTPSSVKPPPKNATVEQLIASANAEFAAADAALARQDLAAFQQHYNRGKQFAAEAQAKGGATTTTTKPG